MTNEASRYRRRMGGLLAAGKLPWDYIPEAKMRDDSIPPAEPISEQRDRFRQALTRISSFAATCRSKNTPEWMAMLVDHLNKTCETLNVSQRFTMGKGEIECVDGDHEDYRG